MVHYWAAGAVKSRMGMIGKIADHMKSIGLMIRGETEFDPGKVQKSAAQIAMPHD